MQVIDNSSVEYKHFFLQGFRVQGGGMSNGTNVEKVGALVIKQAVTTAGTVLNDRHVLMTDVHYDPADTNTPIRIESDLATTKPGLDIVVVRDESVLPPDFNALPVPPPAPPDPGSTIFGDVRITRASGGIEDITWLPYGWFPRQFDPRVGLGGFEADLAVFPDSGAILPNGYRDAFQNGAGENTRAHLQPGDQVTLTENDNNGIPTGNVYTLTVPAAVDLQFTMNGAPVDPQPALTHAIDTVLFDELANEFLLTWRAVFLWDDALELAVLEIN